MTLKHRANFINPALKDIKDPATVQAFQELMEQLSDLWPNVYDDLKNNGLRNNDFDNGKFLFSGYPWQADGYEMWDDLRVPAQNTKLNPSKSEPAFESLVGGLFAYKFNTTNDDDESIHFVAQMPHTYKEGSDYEVHIHWCPDNTNTGNVVWSLEYTIANVDGTISGSTTETIVNAADGTTLKHQYKEITAISGTGLKVSHIIIGRLTRRSSSDARDTFTGNACFLELDFHFKKDTIGSREELTK